MFSLLVFPANPFHQTCIDVAQYPIHLGLVEMRVVVYPTLYLLIEHVRYVLQALIVLQLQSPVPYFLTDCFLGLIRDGGQEVREELSVPILGMPWSECIAQKIKGRIRIAPFAVIILTIYNPCLLLIQFQSTPLEPFFQSLPHIFRLLQRLAVSHSVICIPCPG